MYVLRFILSYFHAARSDNYRALGEPDNDGRGTVSVRRHVRELPVGGPFGKPGHPLLRLGPRRSVVSGGVRGSRAHGAHAGVCVSARALSCFVRFLASCLVWLIGCMYIRTYLHIHGVVALPSMLRPEVL